MTQPTDILVRGLARRRTERCRPRLARLPASSRHQASRPPREAACPRTGACEGGHRKWEQRATTHQRIRATWATGAFNVGIATGFWAACRPPRHAQGQQQWTRLTARRPSGALRAHRSRRPRHLPDPDRERRMAPVLRGAVRGAAGQHGRNRCPVGRHPGMGRLRRRRGQHHPRRTLRSHQRPRGGLSTLVAAEHPETGSSPYRPPQCP